MLGALDSSSVKQNTLKPSTNQTNPKPQLQPTDKSTPINKQPLTLESAYTSDCPIEQPHNPISSIGTDVKNTNIAIGSLEVMIRAIDTLQTHNRRFKSISSRLERTQTYYGKQRLNNHALLLQETMKKTFEGAKFGDENVFYKDYSTLIANNKLNGGILSPERLNINELDSFTQYNTDLSQQKQYAKQAQKKLEKTINARLNKIASINSVNTLDKSRLKPQEFKAAQGGRGIPMERILKLLS